MSTIILTAGGAKPTGDVLTAGGATPPSGGSSGGSGATLTAINKTGSIVTRGQKVWINENAQTQGSSYSIENYASNSITNSSGVLSRSGTFAWRRGSLYAINADSATNIGSFSANAGYIKYGADNSVLLDVNRVDDKAQWTSSYTTLLGEDYFFAGGSGNSKIYKVDMSNGTILQTWTSTNSSTYLSSEGVKVGDYFYRLWSNSAYKCHLDDNGSIVYDGNFNYQNPYTGGGGIYAIGVTADNKYILCSQAQAYSNSTSKSFLNILEVVDDNTIRRLPQSEMPEDLQEFYSANGCYVFNPYTGILTAVTYNGTSYVVMKYENGTWTKLPIDLGIGEEPLKGSLTLSDDLTRACIAYGSTGSWYSYIINLETTSGYAAVPYRFYNVNENTITGYAGNDTEPNMEVIVGIASVPSVDNGGTGGGNYDPTTPPLEEVPFNDSYIDTNKIVSVGRVFNTDRNEPTAVDLANLTENSGFTQYSNSLFTSEDKSLADEFFIRFHLSDRVGDGNMKMQFIYLFGHNMASDGGNWWDETDRSDQFAIPFGFDSEWNYRTFGINTGFVTEDGYHCPNTRVDIGNDLPFGWNTVKVYFNNDIQMWCLAFGDNFSMEYSIPELPKVCKPYNLISLVDVAGYGDNCIDLAETGFKLNGEWVWRAVK